MIKIDYERAWKDLKEEIGDAIMEGGMTGTPIKFTMEMFEQKHTHNYIDIKKRSDKEIADYCLKKHAEVYLENIDLKKKLRDKK